MTESWFSADNVADLLLVISAFLITAIIVVLGYFYLRANRNYDIALKSLGRFEDLAKATRGLNDTKEEVNRLEKRREDLNAEISSLGAQKETINQVRGELDALGLLYESRQKLLNEVESKLAQSKALSDFVETHKNDQIDQLDKLIAEKEQRVAELTNQLNEKLQSGLVKDALKEVFSDITASGEAEKAQKELKIAQEQLAQLQEELTHVQKQVDSGKINEQLTESLKQVFEDLRNQVDAAAAQARLESTTAELKNKQDELDELNGKLAHSKVQDTLNTALSEVFDNISAQNKADAAKDEYKQLQGDIEDAHAELDELSDKLAQAKVQDTLNTALSEVFDNISAQNKADAAKDEYKQLQGDIEDAHAELDELSDKLAQAKVQDTLNTALNDVFTVLSIQHDTDAAQEKLDETRAEVNEANTELKDLQQQIKDAQNQLSREEVSSELTEALSDVVENLQTKATANDARTELEEANAELKDLQHKIKEAQEQLSRNTVNSELTDTLTDIVDKLQTKAASIKALRDLDDVNADIESAQAELEDLQKQLNNATTQLNTNKITESLTFALKKAFSDLQDSLNKSLATMGNQLSSIAKLTSETSHLEHKRDVLNKEIEKLNAAKNGDLSEEEKDLAYAELDQDPQGIDSFLEEVIDVEPFDESEEQALTLFQKYLLSKGFFYSQRTVNAFHTSLKVQHINPISVLAGLSGTGKTRLALLYGDFFGFYREVVSVQPRWDSKDDLLGFYNFLEKRYQPTELVKSLYYFYNRYLEVQKGDDFNPMMMVVLDEMNLARVEYYFSEFLSKLELRAEDDELSKITIGTQLNSRSFKVKPNVVLVGTMNDDESTYSLSDKVLDRANVLHFGKPPKFGSTLDLVQSSESVDPIYVDATTFANWCSQNDADFDDTDLRVRVMETIEELNQALDLVGKAFGYRVQRSICAYVRLYPGVKNNHEREKWALADQIEMKIIPKLAGLEKNDKSDECLNRIKTAISNTNDKPLMDAFQKAYDNYENDGMFLWRGVTRAVTPNGDDN